MRIRRPRSTCVSAQSDQGLRYSITYKMYQSRANARTRLCACAGWIWTCILRMFEDTFLLSVAHMILHSDKIDEPGHSISDKTAYVPSENYDQHAHPRSLISLRCPSEDALAPRRLSCEDSDQTTRMRRLIWIFAGHTCNIVKNDVPGLKYLNSKPVCVIILCWMNRTSLYDVLYFEEFIWPTTQISFLYWILWSVISSSCSL